MRRLPSFIAVGATLPFLAIAGPVAPAVAGPPASAEFRVNTATVSSQFAPDVASDAAGNSVVVWSSDGQDGSGLGVYAQRFAADGTPAGAETRVNGFTTGNQASPSVAMDADGSYVVAWSSDGQDGSGLGVYARRFSADGASRGADFRVNTVVANNQYRPSVAMDAVGNFVVSWTSAAQDGSDDGIYMKAFSAAGVVLRAETRVNTTALDGQDDSTIAMAADGDYVVAWTSDGQDGDLGGIYAQRYSADGTARGPETRVNTTTTQWQTSPSAAMAADGSYVVAWASAHEVDGYGIYAQRYNAGGSPVGGETQVNTTTTSNQESPSVDMDATGGYLVAWHSFSQDGNDAGVYARRYNAAGTALSGETHVSTTTFSAQDYPGVDLDADGDALVAWQSNLQDGDGEGVYARRFRGPRAVDLQLHQVDKADPVPVLGTATYRARVTNLEDASTDTGVPDIDTAIGAATGVYVVSTIPDGATFASSSGAGWTCTPGVTTVKCRLAGPLAADAVSSWLALTYNVPSAAGPLVHQARVYGNQLDAVPANNGESETTAALCTVKLSQEGYTTNETGYVGIQWDRTGTDCGPTSVDWETVAGSATPGADYADGGGDSPFSDGDTTRTVDIPIYPDAIDERLSEGFKIRLSNPTGMLLAHPSTAVVTIFDDDAPPRINFVSTRASAAEPGALVDVSVQLSAVSGVPITVSLTRGGTATSGADYFAPTKLTIPAGQRTTDFTIEVADDAVPEVEEIATLTLAAPTDVVLGSLRTFQLAITSDE